MSIAEERFTARDFELVTRARRVHALSRPSLSYWQDAWLRLKANPRAIGSLYIVLGVLLFTVAGPLAWRVDSSYQDLDQISVPPTLGPEATIVPPYQPAPIITGAPPPWSGEDPVQPPGSLQVIGEANTQVVRLTWQPAAGAGGYAVYRNIVEPHAEHDLGLPLTEIISPAEISFEDRLDLQSRRYWYTVVSLDGNLDATPARATITVTPARVVTAQAALDKGLIANVNDVRPGDQVRFASHPLGTDYLGRDMLARLMHGARVSLFIGIVAPLLFVLAGTAYGGIAGYLAGRTDQLLMRIADFVVALPFLLLMIIFRVSFGVQPGESGVSAMLIAMVLLGWPATARLVRGQVLQIREEGYAQAARLMGASTGYVLARHMLPNTFGVILVTLTFAVPSAIFTEAFLSFIGMGVAPPTPSWGSMCNEGIKTMLSHPHELLFPALFISITVLAFNLLGDGLRDALDARLRSRE